MPTPDVTAGTIMDTSAALLNDITKQSYTYVKQLPYLKVALKDLRMEFELNDIPVIAKTSAVINVPNGTTIIGFNTVPALPSDLVEITELWESIENTNNYIPVTMKHSIPVSLTGQRLGSFGIYAWMGNAINVPNSTSDIDLKIEYIAELFGAIVDENSVIGVINGESYLHFRNAALCAQFIGENKSRADELNGEAQLALQKNFGIESKAKQSITTRRLPFRMGFKRRSR